MRIKTKSIIKCILANGSRNNKKITLFKLSLYPFYN